MRDFGIAIIALCLIALGAGGGTLGTSIYLAPEEPPLVIHDPYKEFPADVGWRDPQEFRVRTATTGDFRVYAILWKGDVRFWEGFLSPRQLELLWELVGLVWGR